MKQRKVPMRMCTGCGQMKPKRELVRIVRGSQGEVSVDRTGRKPGRGAYICDDIECLRKARKSRRLEKSFGCPIPDEVYAQLEEALTTDG